MAKAFTEEEKIIKKDGSREAFDRSKIMNGIVKACEKRPVPVAEIKAGC